MEAAGASDDVGVHGEREDAAAAVELVEGIAPGGVDMLGGGHQAASVGGCEDEVGVVVERPVDGKFGEAGRGPVGGVAAHQAGVVAETALAQQAEGVVAQFPGRGAVADGRVAGDAAQDFRAAVEHLGLLLGGERGGRLVEIAVVADFMSGGGDPLNDGGAALGDPAGHVEGGGDAALFEQSEDMRHGDRRPVVAEGAGGGAVLHTGIAVDHARCAVDIKGDDDGALVGVAGGLQRCAAAGAVAAVGRPAARRAGHRLTRSR